MHGALKRMAQVFDEMQAARLPPAGTNRLVEHALAVLRDPDGLLSSRLAGHGIRRKAIVAVQTISSPPTKNLATV